jgi:hypothetical protein
MGSEGSGSRGVFLQLTYQSRNTPLRPSQEGNRTFPHALNPKVNTNGDNTNNDVV